MFVVDEIGISVGFEGMSQFEKGMARIEAALFITSKRLTGAANGINSFMAPLMRFRQEAVAAATEFESAFAGVVKTVNATEPQLQAIQDGIRAMAQEIPTTAVELSNIAAAAGQLGIKQESILGFTRTMADLAETTNLGGEEGATQLARLANITGMSQDNFDRLGSTVVALGNNLATTEAEIVAMGLRLAGSGKQVGLTEHQILSLSGALSSVGVQAELGGSALSRVMLSIDSEVKGGGKHMAEFAKLSGKSVQDFTNDWKKDAAGSLVGMLQGLDKINKEGGDAAGTLKQLGFKGIGITDVMLRAAGANELMADALGLGAKAWEENTALAKEAEIRYQTFASQMAIFKNRLTEIQIEIGNALIPVVQKMNVLTMNWIQYWHKLNDQQKQTAIVIGAVATSIGPMLLMLGRMLNIVSSLGIAFTMVGRALSIYKAAAIAAAVASAIAPFLPLIGILAAVTFAVYKLVDAFYVGNSNTAMGGWAGAWDDIKAAMMAFAEFAQGFMHNFRENMGIVLDWLKLNWRGVLDGMLQVIAATLGVIPDLLWIELKTIVRLWAVTIGWIKGALERLWEYIFTSDMIDKIVTGLASAWRAFQEFMMTVNMAFVGLVMGMGQILMESAPLIKQLLIGMITMNPADVTAALGGIGQKFGTKFADEINAAGAAMDAAHKQLQNDFQAGQEAVNPLDPMLKVLKEGGAEAKAALADAYKGVGFDVTTPRFNLDRLVDDMSTPDIVDPLAEGIKDAGKEAEKTGKAIDDMLKPLRKEETAIGWGSQEMFTAIFRQGLPANIDKAGMEAEKMAEEAAAPMSDTELFNKIQQDANDFIKNNTYTDPRNAPVMAPVVPMDPAQASEAEYGPVIDAPLIAEEPLMVDQTHYLDEIAQNTRPGNVPEIVIDGALSLQ